MGNHCDLKSNANFFRNKAIVLDQLKATCQVFSDLVDIISLKYCVKRCIEVIQQSHNLQVKKKYNRKIENKK